MSLKNKRSLSEIFEKLKMFQEMSCKKGEIPNVTKFQIYQMCDIMLMLILNTFMF